MSTADYIAEVRRAIRDLIEAGMEDSEVDIKRDSQQAIEKIRGVIVDIVEETKGKLVGSESRIALDEVAHMLGYTNGRSLMIAFDVRPKSKPDHVPPPPP